MCVPAVNAISGHDRVFLLQKLRLLTDRMSPNKIHRVSKFDNSLSFGAKQNVLGQIFLELRFFRDFFTENSN